MSLQQEIDRKGPDYASQLDINLQGFDQVVAISQQTINTSLAYRFAADSSLKTIRTQSHGDWKIEAPSVELIDAPNGGDGALVFVKLAQPSKFSYVDTDGSSQTISLAGSKLAFALTFKLEKTSSVPDEVREQVHDLASYTVSQLIVDFSAAGLATFKPDKSTFPSFSKAPEPVKTQFAEAVAKHLQWIDSSGKVTALSSSLTAVKPEIVQQQTATSPPTSVRLQTMYYRPPHGAEASNSSKNAFLFTEMCKGRSMHAKDLTWTGNWFCAPANGTMVLSKTIFWREYLIPKLAALNTQAEELLNSLSRLTSISDLCEHDLPAWQVGAHDSMGQTGQWNVSPGAQSGFIEYQSSKDRPYNGTMKRPWYVKDEPWEYNINSNVQTRADIVPGFGKVTFTAVLQVQHRANIKVNGSWHESRSDAYINFILGINFVSSDKGRLRITVTVDHIDADAKINRNKPDSNAISSLLSSAISGAVSVGGAIGGSGVASGIASLSGPLVQLVGYKNVSGFTQDFKSQLEQDVRNRGLGSDVEKQLNGQQQFVFAGGGTFAMKDPSFNKEGDLMIGLTYELRAKDDTETMRKALGLEDLAKL